MTPKTVGSQDARGEVIGLVPVAGRGSRLALPFSKELYPIGLRSFDDGSTRPKAAIQYLLEKMRRAEITRAYLMLRAGKWDIPGYLLEGNVVDMRLAYLVVASTRGVPFTLDLAYPFVREALVAFGFPDLLFEAGDAFAALLRTQMIEGGDVVLGLFRGDDPGRMDMVDVDERGNVRQVLVRPAATRLTWTWGIAVWTPVFTRYLHEYAGRASAPAAAEMEPQVGDVIQAAVETGLRVRAIRISDGPLVDIGTPDGLARVVARFPPWSR